MLGMLRPRPSCSRKRERARFLSTGARRGQSLRGEESRAREPTPIGVKRFVAKRPQRPQLDLVVSFRHLFTIGENESVGVWCERETQVPNRVTLRRPSSTSRKSGPLQSCVEEDQRKENSMGKTKNVPGGGERPQLLLALTHLAPWDEQHQARREGSARPWG